MWRTVLVLAWGCGSSATPATPQNTLDISLADHKLHDFSEDGAYALHKKLSGVGVPATDIPIVSKSLTLPVSGAIDVAVDVVVPGRDLRSANGNIEVGCRRCQVGDDVTRLKMKMGYLGDSVEFGHITVDRLVARIELANGAAELATWRFVSPDLELELSLRTELAQDWASSPIHGCLRYKVRPELEERSPKMAALLAITGAMLGEDGFFHIALEGTLGDIKKLARNCK
jgi:type II secretion system protein N